MTELQHWKKLQKLQNILTGESNRSSIQWHLPESELELEITLSGGHIVPINKNGSLITAKVIVYAGEPDEYFTFITPEAYFALDSWMNFRMRSGDSVNVESWVMRNLWNSLRPMENSISRKSVDKPEKLNSIGVKRLIERALWTQGLRTKLPDGKKRHEFQTDHGFRKFFKTQSEISGMKPINVEILMGHSVGLSDSYYKATELELLNDYLKAVNHLTINEENRLKLKLEQNIQVEKSQIEALKADFEKLKQELSKNKLIMK